MAKIGGPVSPGVPRNNAPAAGNAQPATPPKAAQAPAAPPAPAASQINAQVVAQQFTSAFVSAGKLAGQLVKGLVSNTAQLRRSEKPQNERADESKGEGHSPETEQGAQEADGKGSAIMSAFQALKRTRLFRFRKTVKKGRGGVAEVNSHIILPDDYNEKERGHQKARNYLGDEQEDTSFDEAKREAFFLQHMERLGEPPTRVARHLNSLLGVDRDYEFKNLLAEQVRPQMDAMAGKVVEASPEERRALAALISRASFQVGVKSSENFARLLASVGAAEASELLASTEGPVALAEQLAQAVRRAASPPYRVALIEAGSVGLVKLGGDMVKLRPEELQRTWSSLLRVAEGLELDTIQTLAESLMDGMLAKGGAGVVGPLAEAMGPALRSVPAGGPLVVLLIATLTARNEVKAAEHLTGTLREAIREALGNCTPALMALRDARANPANGADADALLEQLDEQVPLLTGLVPTCVQVLEKGQGIPQSASAILAEALMVLATLNIVGETSAGQGLLRRALLAQERGSETFLPALPRAALTLAQPKLVRPLWDAGLTPAHFQFGGKPYLEGVALHTGRVLGGTVLARLRKGDSATAKLLLRLAVRNNAALFGLTPNGAYLAAEALEALRERPSPGGLKRTLIRLGKIRKKNSLGQHPNSIEPLQDLVSALAGGEHGRVTVHGPAEIVP